MNMSSPSRPANRELPAVDERLVASESGYEIDDGKLVRVPPCKEPHGNPHSKLAALLEAHVAEDFNVALDMLTRISETTDRAADASVYPFARDPQTGGRQIEQLAFEIVSTESLADAGRKAGQLSGRGVRRVFAIDVERARVFEWSRELGTWSLLDPHGRIEDPTLAVPLSIELLVRSVKTDDALANALLAKRNPVLLAAIDEGRAHAMADAILRVLEQRSVHLDGRDRERVLAARVLAQLERWLDRAATCSQAAELFRDDADR
jgi:Uma2 family endonuclease